MLAALVLWFLLLSAPGVEAHRPTFAEYPADSKLSGKPVPPKLKSHPLARKYRTVLRESAKEGVNFAGAFTFVRIGAGTATNYFAVVDARDGRVYFPSGLPMGTWADWWHDPCGPEFQASSRLLVFYGRAGSEEAATGKSYFEWTGTDFKLIMFTPLERGAPPK